jgi:pyrroloquinoline-quinone synthase
VDFFERLESARARWNVLEHPFYLRWSAGELTREELATYAGEYRHAVAALASGLAAAGFEEHAAEEAGHVELWDDFGRAVGAELDRPAREETVACAEAWTAGADTLEGLAIAYAIESGQPEISRVKLDGLVRHYGMEEGPATAYFELHAELDKEHAARSRELIQDRMEAADADRLLAAAEGALRGNWRLLDGVEKVRREAAA